jgi:hypothetical protein
MRVFIGKEQKKPKSGTENPMVDGKKPCPDT